MYKRKAYETLVRWKGEYDGASAMLIEGARRVGKSTIAEEFARNEYATHMVIDFSRVTAEFKQNFLDLRSDLDALFLYLQAATGVQLVRGDSLVIFDEVQRFPQAREFVKHLVADGRYHYVETGSLVSIRENVKDILLPSEESSMRMVPMDFEEFLWAAGEDALAQMVRVGFDGLRALPDDLHRKAMRLWREYMLVGGMPQAVSAYFDGRRDMEAADRQKRLILKLYRDDIDKHGGTAAKRVKAVFDAIPGQLAKHEKKLVYTQVDEGSRSRDFMTAFAWMRDAGTVNICELCTDPTLGLALSADEATVKCYLGDTGLLSTMAFSAAGERALPEVYRQVLLGDAAVNEGMLLENAVAQQLAAAGHGLYFYAKSSQVREERMEVDFLTVRPWGQASKPRVSPIEVKSGKRYSPKSLDKFKAKFGSRVGAEYVLHPKQLEVEGDRVFLPLYMAFCL